MTQAMPNIMTWLLQHSYSPVSALDPYGRVQLPGASFSSSSHIMVCSNLHESKAILGIAQAVLEMRPTRKGIRLSAQLSCEGARGAF